MLIIHRDCGAWIGTGAGSSFGGTSSSRGPCHGFIDDMKTYCSCHGGENNFETLGVFGSVALQAAMFCCCSQSLDEKNEHDTKENKMVE